VTIVAAEIGIVPLLVLVAAAGAPGGCDWEVGARGAAMRRRPDTSAIVNFNENLLPRWSA
jgi:hypothetical protein